ncbi:GntR family transcriptional regulator [Trueperella pyogenes]
MNNSQREYLSNFSHSNSGQPLRIAMYAHLAGGIQQGIFELGAVLPRETELAAASGVSRTVVREALMLLEEDGRITTRRGVGRFVNTTLPKSGIEEFSPFELALSADRTPLKVNQGDVEIQRTTQFTSTYLNLDDEANTWFRESVLEHDDRPVAILQEHLPAGLYLKNVSQTLANSIREAASIPGSLLTGILTLCGPIFTSAQCIITATVAGATRAKLVGLKSASPVLLSTQVASIGDTPAYMSKCIISPEFGHVEIVQRVATV